MVADQSEEAAELTEVLGYWHSADAVHLRRHLVQTTATDLVTTAVDPGCRKENLRQLARGRASSSRWRTISTFERWFSSATPVTIMSCRMQCVSLMPWRTIFLVRYQITDADAMSQARRLRW